MDSLLLLYAVLFGGAGRDFPQAIAVDGAGQAIVSGSTASDNFPTTAGAILGKPKARAWHSFVMNTEGTRQVFSTYLGGGSHSYGSAVAAGAQGEVCAAGATAAADFPVTAGAAQTKFGGSGGRRGAGDAFVAKFDASGKLVYASYFGASSDEGATAVGISERGECIVGGFTTSGDLATTRKSAYAKRPPGLLSGFLAVFSPDGSRVTYATYLPHDVSAMRIRAEGVSYVAGKDRVSRIGWDGKKESWSVAAGLDGGWIRAMALDGADHLWVVSEAGNGGKGEVIRLRTKDGGVAGRIPYGETGFTSIHSIAAAPDGRIWTGGSTGQPGRAFVALLDASGTELMRHEAGDKGEQQVRALAAGPAGMVFAAGEAAEDVFVWKLQVNSARGRTAIQTQPAIQATNRR
jgi:hypothetical protein